MTDAELTFIADALLSMCDKPADRPFYTEEALRKRLNRETCDNVLYLNLASVEKDDDLLRQEFAGIFAEARLTQRQEQVMTRKMIGRSFEEIGRELLVSKQSAQHSFVQGLKKLHRALRVYPYAGLSAVYRSETKRGAAKKAA